MSRQQGHAPDSAETSKPKASRKRRPWHLWVTYSWLKGETRTYRSGRYITEQDAKDAGAQMLRKHPTFYLSFDVEHEG